MRDRLRDMPVARKRMCGMAVSAADVVAPVFATLEIITFLFAGVAGQAGLGDVLS